MEQPKIQYGPKGKRARLLEEYVVVVDKKWKADNGHLIYVGTVRVPKDFVTDFASIPRFFHRILPKQGKYSPAAVVHDYLYFINHVPKEIADYVFDELMKRCNVSRWKRYVMYQAVKRLGWSAWEKHRQGKHPHGEGS